MKAFCLFLVLGIFAMACVAQTASLSLENGAGASTLGNGTANLEDRIESAAAAHTLFDVSGAPGASWPQLASNLSLAEDSDLLFSTSRQPYYNFLLDGDAARYTPAGLPNAEDAGANSKLAVQPVEPPQPDTRIHWRSANGEALLATGICHIFNLWTEAGTRDALYGPWAKDWLRSVGELRGWSDSDEFMAPYASHPIQGSIYGYILRQNDPKYRTVQWGDGRDYFISVLRSMAYSAVWHTQWKIGPISEASIGN